MALFICWADWAMELENCLISPRNEISVPMVVENIPSPKRAMAPPATAANRYSKFPKPAITGIIMFDAPPALKALS